MSENDTQINRGPQNGDAHKTKTNPALAKMGSAKDKITDKKQKLKDKNEPAGGFSDTPIPFAPDGYTVKFTFHRAVNLPISDIKARSSDPFIHATLTSPLPKRHKEDPDVILRTKTVHENVNPEWNQEWIVAGIPSSGFKLKCRIFDEDPLDHDDRLGNVSIYVKNVNKSWPGIREQEYDVKKRMASKRAYTVRGCAAMFNRNVHMDAKLYVSAELLGESDKPHGRMYTVGPINWIKHFSPMIGRIAGTKAPGEEEGNGQQNETPKTEKYDFQANEFQLSGPVPAELYHRFVEFKPFVKGMFSSTGLRGKILNSALHHQHSRVYNYSKSTKYGSVQPRSEEAALRFLELVHYDEGGRIFTYVLTLDGLLRFTETGKEFGIDLLSKHTMHSDVNIYIACSGEFFVRRLAKPDKSVDDPQQQSHPNSDIPGGPPNAPPPKDPHDYELIIDNDSGTYRPKGSLLPLLKQFLNDNFPGMHVKTMECTDDKLDKMKDEQRERKKREGQNIELVQNSDDEISSSDEEALDKREKRMNKKRKAGRKTGKQEKLVEIVEDPGKVARGMVPGLEGRHEREERETEGDRAEGSGVAAS